MNKSHVVVIFYRIHQENGIAEFAAFETQKDSERNFRILELADDSLLNKLLTTGNLRREALFDQHFIDAKIRCVLCEALADEVVYAALEEAQLRDEAWGREFCLRWCRFPELARHLTCGTHRRLLQLAVQFLSQGRQVDSVDAAACTPSFLKGVRQALDKKNQGTGE